MVTPLEPDSQIASLNFLPEMVSNRDRVLPTDLMLLGLVVVMGIGVRGIANHLSTRLHKQPSATPMLRNYLIIVSILFLMRRGSRINRTGLHNLWLSCRLLQRRLRIWRSRCRSGRRGVVHFSRQAFLWEGINIYMTWLLQLFFSFSFGKI
jgi:hypothetical protein